MKFNTLQRNTALFSAFLALVIISSCKKVTHDEVSAPSCYTQTYTEGAHHITYYYDANSNITAFADRDSSGLLTDTVAFSYNTFKLPQLTKALDKNNNIVEQWTYNNDGYLAEVDYFAYAKTGGNTVKSGYSQFFYLSGEANPYKMANYHHSAGSTNSDTLTSTLNFIYNDAGDIRQTVLYDNFNNIIETVNYLYDDKASGNFNRPSGFKFVYGGPNPTGPNNITKIERLDGKGNVISTYNYTYLYNSNNYPDSRTGVDDKGNHLLPVSYTYICN